MPRDTKEIRVQARTLDIAIELAILDAKSILREDASRGVPRFETKMTLKSIEVEIGMGYGYESDITYVFEIKEK